jgi:hypothetical protein
MADTGGRDGAVKRGRRAWVAYKACLGGIEVYAVDWVA